MAAWLAPLAGAVLPSVFGAASSAFGAKRQERVSQAFAREQMDFQAGETALARDFAERMSSTAHQRQVADLRAAGLNPILAAGGQGASAPTSPAASGAMGEAQDVTGQSAMAAMQVREHRQSLKNMRAQEQLLEAQEEKTKHEGERAESLSMMERARAGAYGVTKTPQGTLHIDWSLPGMKELVESEISSAQSRARLDRARIAEQEAISKLFETSGEMGPLIQRLMPLLTRLLGR